ncbi:MAG: hypothetical protein WC975_03475 [Phycisphaerae bacterium]
MLQCKDCEFCVQDTAGRVQLRCNPFSNVREPECLQKWTLLKLDIMVRSYQATLNFYQKLAPLQEKMLKHIEREIGDIEDADRWKYNEKPDEQQDIDDDTGLP